MERLNHFGNITTSHKHAIQLSLRSTDRINGRLIIHLSFQSELIQMITRIFVVSEINNSRGTRTFQIRNLHITEHRIVLQQESVIQYKVTVFNTESLTSSLVNIFQHALVIIINHINQRGIEYGMITHQQLVDIFYSAVLLCHIVLNTDNAQHSSMLIMFTDRQGNLIVSAIVTILSIAEQGNRSDFLLAFTYIIDGRTQHLEIIAIEELWEFYRIVFLFLASLFRQEIIMTSCQHIFPYAQATSSQHQCQTRILLIQCSIVESFAFQIDAIIAKQDENSNEHYYHDVNHAMVQIKHQYCIYC